MLLVFFLQHIRRDYYKRKKKTRILKVII